MFDAIEPKTPKRVVQQTLNHVPRREELVAYRQFAAVVRRLRRIAHARGPPGAARGNYGVFHRYEEPTTLLRWWLICDLTGSRGKGILQGRRIDSLSFLFRKKPVYQYDTITT